MNTEANIIEIFENVAKKCIELRSKINEATKSYDFEKAFKGEMAILAQSVYQAIIGDCDVMELGRSLSPTKYPNIRLLSLQGTYLCLCKRVLYQRRSHYMGGGWNR